MDIIVLTEDSNKFGVLDIWKVPIERLGIHLGDRGENLFIGYINENTHDIIPMLIPDNHEKLKEFKKDNYLTLCNSIITLVFNESLRVNNEGGEKLFFNVLKIEEIVKDLCESGKLMKNVEEN